MGIIDKLFGSYSAKELKRLEPIVVRIEELEPLYAAMTDEELRAQTEAFRKRLGDGQTLDDILPEAFAVVREAGKRVLGMRHFRVQLLGGLVLHQGRIAEMRTGEGKTLVSTLPAYLNALAGKGVHIVTVNDYLARRDRDWMGQLHEFLGLSVGVILHDMTGEERRAAYACDITYATNNELGFDYLRDNMVVRHQDMVQRELSYSIIDEVDSVLIDEARTPLIISGPTGKSTKLYSVADDFVRTLNRGKLMNEDEALNPLMRSELIEEGDFVVDEKAKSVSLTQEGVKKAEKFFGVDNLSDPANLELQHHVNNALKANFNMHRDKDYVVQDDEIVIVDEFTGRLMPGRRYSDGLHQAIEAKERVKVKRESKTLATITFQNFFNKYGKKSGMTGTALTEEGEFRQIYGMDVVTITTNLPIARADHPDLVYRTVAAKYRAIIRDIQGCYERGQPVLVGTVTIEKSEELSKLLKREGIPHNVLNAKFHEKEAEIVADAGLRGAITIATNMAGRGTDIKLGEGVVELGGLKIIGTERHESRRIDNQLRGRSGRQGDPGESRFYISMEDDLFRLFAAERVIKVLDTVGLEEDEPLEHNMLSKAIENAQKRVEGNNFGIRKHLLDYDRVMNEQREIMYSERMKVLTGQDLRENIINMIGAVVGRAVDLYTGQSELPEDWDIKALNDHLLPMFHRADTVVISEQDKEGLTKEALKQRILSEAQELYARREAEFGPERTREIEHVILLRIIDHKWMDHIDDMDQMRQGISLRAYAQRDPIVEYKFLSYEMFEELGQNIQLETVRAMFNVRVAIQPDAELEQERQKMEQQAKQAFTNRQEAQPSAKAQAKKAARPGRNDPCHCGSGKKYKHCHALLDA